MNQICGKNVHYSVVSRRFSLSCTNRKSTETTIGHRHRLSSPIAGKNRHNVVRACSSDDAFDVPQPTRPDPALINEDLRPVTASERKFTVWDFFGLWVGLVVSITTYSLAGSLVDLGMSWWQAVSTIFTGNVIVLGVMILNGRPGTKYGIPFPVLARSSFGVKGASIAAILRGVVACGWFGIQTWICADAMSRLAEKLIPSFTNAAVLPGLGITPLQFGCFVFFWGVQVLILMRGVDSIRLVERYSAPILILMSFMLVCWAVFAAGGVGSMLSQPSQFGPGMPLQGQFWRTFFPALTANVGYWATLSLNIPDFTRYSKSQQAQAVGQVFGLPICMALFSFVGILVTNATVVIFGTPLTNPIDVLARLQGWLPTFLGLIGVLVATVSTNLAANIVAPANALSNLAPQKITFKMGAVASSILGAVILPWKLISSTQGYIFTWLIGYSALLGPMAGIFLTDHYILNKGELDMDALYSMDTEQKYWHQGGVNIAAMLALVGGALPCLPGFLATAGCINKVPAIYMNLYSVAWFVGFGLGSALYFTLSKLQGMAEDFGKAGNAPSPVGS